MITKPCNFAHYVRHTVGAQSVTWLKTYLCQGTNWGFKVNYKAHSWNFPVKGNQIYMSWRGYAIKDVNGWAPGIYIAWSQKQQRGFRFLDRNRHIQRKTEKRDRDIVQYIRTRYVHNTTFLHLVLEIFCVVNEHTKNKERT